MFQFLYRGHGLFFCFVYACRLREGFIMPCFTNLFLTLLLLIFGSIYIMLALAKNGIYFPNQIYIYTSQFCLHISSLFFTCHRTPPPPPVFANLPLIYNTKLNLQLTEKGSTNPPRLGFLPSVLLWNFVHCSMITFTS